MADFVYPTNAELQEVGRVKAARLEQNRPIFRLMPIVTSDAHILEWEQEDDWTGLQQLRGLGGAPGRVKQVGAKRFLVEPGVYGEFARIDEIELTTRRQFGTFDRPVDINDLVMRNQDRLLQRRLDRLEYIGWTLITTGTYSVSGPGGVVHTDSYPLQTHAGSDWSDSANATPIADFRAVKLKARGKGVSFGRQATAYVNEVTANRLLGNKNANDLWGQRRSGGNTLATLEEFNKILLDNDLPQIETYDEGYLDDAGTFVPFIGDDKVAVVGKRTDGGRIMDYAMTRNANNPGMKPGAYMKVDDDPKRIPRFIDVHDGHNGGPRIYFPSAIVVMSV